MEFVEKVRKGGHIMMTGLWGRGHIFFSFLIGSPEGAILRQGPQKLPNLMQQLPESDPK